MACILVVDDEKDLREVLERNLTGAGHTVVQAEDGRQALRILGETGAGVDLVLCDIYMPEKDGIEVILQCRRMRLKVIAMSGGSVFMPMDALSAVRLLGAHDAMQKPFSMEEMLKKVKQALATP
jgi:DNA-binding NtrC family response regulator